MYQRKTFFLVLTGLLSLGALPGAQATDRTTHVAYSPAIGASRVQPALAGAELVLSAPPRETAEQGARRFGPVAAYLSEVLGRRVVYRHPGTWGAYQAEMLKGTYDLVFDAPHFNGWRVERLGHNVLVKVPGEYTYTIFVRKDNDRVHAISQLAGRKVCAHAPPHLGTLVMWRQFDNPSRQPMIVVTDGYHKIYESLLAGKCEAAVLSMTHLQKWDPEGTHTRVIYKNRALPQQALSSGPRLTAAEQAKVTAALLAPAGQVPLQALRESYGFGNGLVAARNDDYAGLGEYLRNEWGYY